MKKMIFVLIGIVGIMISCATTPPAPSMETLKANLKNQSPPMDCKEQIDNYFQTQLFNPVGIIVEYENPQMAWANFAIKDPGWMHGYRQVYGFMVCGYFNAQNRFGGYMGRQRYYSFFYNGKLIYLDWGTPAWQICK